MACWTDRYIGIPWAYAPETFPAPMPSGWLPKSINCGELVRLVYRRERGLDLLLPMADPASARDCLRGIRRLPDFGWRAVEPPQEFDMAAIGTRGLFYHVGLAAPLGEAGELGVLHASQTAGMVCLDNLLELRAQGWDMVRWYRHG